MLETLESRIGSLPAGKAVEAVQAAYGEFAEVYRAGIESSREQTQRLTGLIESLLVHLLEIQTQAAESAQKSAEATNAVLQTLVAQGARYSAIIGEFPPDTPTSDIVFWLRCARKMPGLISEKYGMRPKEFMVLR
jgi:hypothetical protein